MAGVEGFEPTNAGIKTRCLNHLATPQYYGGCSARPLPLSARGGHYSDLSLPRKGKDSFLCILLYRIHILHDEACLIVLLPQADTAVMRTLPVAQFDMPAFGIEGFISSFCRQPGSQ